MEADKKKVEAVLFAVGKEVSVERLASLCSLREERVVECIKKLKEEYDSVGGSLRVTCREDWWKLTVKDDFLPLVNNIVTELDMDKALMETLAVIAWKYPVVQSEVIKLRHNKAYEHIKQLMEMGFVGKERFGRTYKLKLTGKFFEYFDLPSAEAKKAFLEKVPAEILREAEEVEREAGEVEEMIEEQKQEESVREEIKKAMGSVR